ncbi:MAG: hypothetical protein R3A44_05000 [Caldilineaceae bacterium]
MDFRLRQDARDWFRDLQNSFNVDFDIYYFCFMAGIAAGRKTEIPTAETAELVDYFPDRYRDRGKLMVALFLSKELEELGVAMDEKKSVNAMIARLTSPDARNHLSDEGMREFNKYAHGGFDVLLDWFDDRPRSLETFLRMFKRQADTVLA